MRQTVQELAALYQSNLFVVAFNICKNAQDAEDIVQETFVQYYTIRKEFESEQHIRAWLIRVAVNKAKNVTRTFWRRNKVSIEDSVKNKFFTRQICAYAQIRRFWQEWRFIWKHLLLRHQNQRIYLKR